VVGVCATTGAVAIGAVATGSDNLVCVGSISHCLMGADVPYTFELIRLFTCV